jgi:hypothetical protein
VDHALVDAGVEFIAAKNGKGVGIRLAVYVLSVTKR